MIHDCGVFALKVAYILSLLTQVPELQALDLSLEYIVLPGHISSQTSMLEYLKLSEEDTRKLQKEVTPMVNKEVEKLWTEVQGDLSARFTAMQRADLGAFEAARDMYEKAAERYNAGVDVVLAKIRKIYGYDFTNETSLDVGRTAEVKSFNGRANNPRLAPGAALSRSSALSGPLAEPWQTVRFHALQQHAEDVLSIAGMERDEVRKLQPTHPGLQPPIRFSED